MNKFERAARILVKNHGRTKAKELVNNTQKKLDLEMLKASSINEGIDISNRMADNKAVLMHIENMHSKT
jgi:hypothetical protein